MPKKIPSRMCVVCRNMFEKPDLIRVVKGADGVSIDLTGKKRGAARTSAKIPNALKNASKNAFSTECFRKNFRTKFTNP